MKVVSFNVNGLRARLHQLETVIEIHQPDVIGLQEIKVHDDEFPLADIENLGYRVVHHGQKGHYGVAILSKQEPLAVQKGFPGESVDAQRRFIATVPCKQRYKHSLDQDTEHYETCSWRIINSSSHRQFKQTSAWCSYPGLAVADLYSPGSLA